MALTVGLAIGIMIGWMLGRFIFREPIIGSLRIDKSDPNDEPYLFLELDRNGAEAFYKKTKVCLRVKLENYVPHI